MHLNNMKETEFNKSYSKAHLQIQKETYGKKLKTENQTNCQEPDIFITHENIPRSCGSLF